MPDEVDVFVRLVDPVPAVEGELIDNFRVRFDVINPARQHVNLYLAGAFDGVQVIKRLGHVFADG